MRRLKQDCIHTYSALCYWSQLPPKFFSPTSHKQASAHVEVATPSLYSSVRQYVWYLEEIHSFAGMAQAPIKSSVRKQDHCQERSPGRVLLKIVSLFSSPTPRLK